jgi:mono/diheme cytochrome c family protein
MSKQQPVLSALAGGVVLLALGFSASAAAEGENAARATYHYQMFCQGCHTPDGSGSNGVPALKDHVGLFLHTPKGREFLIRVPGSATSVLSDEHLAEVLNWIVIRFAGASWPDKTSFERFTPDEVARGRVHPLTEINHYRAEVLAEAEAAARQE